MASTDSDHHPSESNLSGTSTTGFSLFCPRVEAVDTLTGWADFVSWQSRISRTLRIAGVKAEDVVSPRYEGHAMTILEHRLSNGILHESRKNTSFMTLWKWLSIF